MNLKIIEWNINQRMNYSHKNMPNWIADVITHEAADIIALTEVYKGNNWNEVKTTSFNLSCEKPSQLYISLNNLPVKSVLRPIL